MVRAAVCCLLLLLGMSHLEAGRSWAAQDQKPTETPPADAVDKAAEPNPEEALPKYADMELPSAEVLLRSKPFDWIVLKSTEVVVVEPVPLRPDTLVKMNLDYERYLKGRAGFLEGSDRLKERRRQFQILPLTLVQPGEGQEPDYILETKMIQKIEYFEDLILRRTNVLISESNIPLAYDLLLLVDRRHRDNNVRLTEAYQSQRREEADIAASDERVRYTVPEPLPLKLSASWPKFDETYQKLLMTDAELHCAQR